MLVLESDSTLNVVMGKSMYQMTFGTILSNTDQFVLNIEHDAILFVYDKSMNNILYDRT